MANVEDAEILDEMETVNDPPSDDETDAKYWCHQCACEIVPVFPGFTCPQCNNDFIEILETEDGPEVIPETPAETIPQRTLSLDLFEQLFGLMTPLRRTPPQAQTAQNTQPQQSTIQPQLPPIPGQPTANIFFGGTGMNNLFHQLFHSDFGSVAMNNFFNETLGFRGNPGDYVWGREFEDILNQMFQSGGSKGNPPASESAIQQLPQMTIGQPQVDDKADCAICKDEFELGIQSSLLPCKHFFHENCIITWLKMHNQCPVCRYELPTDDPHYEEQRKQKAQANSTTSNTQ